VENFAAAGSAVAGGPAGEARPSAPAAARVSVLRDEEIPVTGMRAAIARRLGESAAAPHFFLRTAVYMDALMDARTGINAEGKAKLSLNAFFMKLAAEAIKRHPRINSTWKEKVIEMHGSVDIGLAVALPDGLITPVVRNCGGRSVSEIDAELSVLIDKARRGGLKPEEYSGATFSISTLGNYGIEEFTAIINPPGSAILALGETRREPVAADDDELSIRRVMRMTLTCDHRTIDGAVGAVFLRDLKLMIEEPLRALV
jgi:pyruvate dehydrogenase E2 component (dihydrolipoamide acetyltransferase)